MGKRKLIGSLILINFSVLILIVIITLLGNRSVNTIMEHLSITNRTCVIIDAGHGGMDGGAVSCTGVPESLFNLEIALRLDDMMNLLGINTKMIRTTDVSVYTKGETIAAKKVSDLKNRVKIVNNTDHPILISIHQNHFSDSRYNGAQVFYGNSNESAVFAKNMQSALVRILNPSSNRKEKKADGIYLLNHINTPAILIECGFLSNPREEAMLKNANYQKKLCAAIAAETATYINAMRTA